MWCQCNLLTGSQQCNTPDTCGVLWSFRGHRVTYLVVVPHVSLILSEEVTSFAPTTAFMVEGGCGLLTYPLDNFKTKKSVGWTCGRGWFVNMITLPKWARWSFRCLAAGPRFESSLAGFDPFTAPACQISGLKDAWTHLQTVYFRSYTVYFQCDVFQWKSFHVPVWKSSQRFQILHFDWLFSSDIMAVKGLIVSFKIVICGLFLSASCYHNSHSFWQRTKQKQ